MVVCAFQMHTVKPSLICRRPRVGEKDSSLTRLYLLFSFVPRLWSGEPRNRLRLLHWICWAISTLLVE